MPQLIAYDTETTGIPDWKIPSDDPSQPHLVQVGAVVYDTDERRIVETLNVIVKPDGWVIPDEVANIHGITTERALAEGVRETEAVDRLLALCEDRTRIAYNRTFDQRIIRIALKRHGYSSEIMEAWANRSTHECSMFMAKQQLGYQPKLVEALKKLTGKDPRQSHDALSDAQAALDIYLAIIYGREATTSADTEQASG